MRSSSIAAVAVVISLAPLAGCGATSHHPRSITAAKALRPFASDQSALTVQALRKGAVSAQAGGRILASSGFDPTRDGFSFENYSFVAGAELDQHAMRELFGDVVCADTPSDSCTLTPAAQHWAEQQSAQMSQGHCLGFSVTALRFFKHLLEPRQFGGTTAFSLSFAPPLQSEIAYGWVGQAFRDFWQAAETRTPTDTVKFLEQALAGRAAEAYTLGIYLPDGRGGHAITPIAVEDVGGGRFNVDIYDNNFPGTARAIEINTNNDSWSYQGGPNPNDTSELYSGHGRVNPIITEPLSASLRKHACPFCAGGANHSQSGTVTVTLGGDPVAHGHLLITTADGRRLGYVHGRFSDQIPGAHAYRPLLSAVWKAQPEPIYELPAGSAIKVTLDGTGASGTDAATVSVSGPGFGATVSNLRPRAGISDALEIGSGGRTLALRSSGAAAGQAPTLQLASDHGRSGSELTVTPTALGDGGLTVGLDSRSGRLSVQRTGPGAAALVRLSLRRVGPTGSHTTQSSSLALSTSRQVFSLALHRIS